MGLSSVELILAIEEEFGIEIRDTDAAHLEYAGAMHAFIVRRLQEIGAVPDSNDVWIRLRNVTVEQLGVRPDEVIPTASFVRDLGAD